eukprot:TRINITY_DN13334_c0_g1_i1.p1 TRINITY_DN13334_c0_g1~~TRINITY_DN13334_c0_g1_i1.p1  ORF type:complete len:1018 (-),score=143.78 TRINITY_DN13334_c0_g1_i1:155-3208(-)
MSSTEVLFPGSTNWYIAHGLDALPCGRIALASNQSVTLLDGATRRVGRIAPLKSRVTGVALYDAGVFAACADRVVHHLNATTLAAVGTHRGHQAEPSAIVAHATSGGQGGKGTCISGDKRGVLCIWSPGDPSGDNVRKVTPYKEPVFALAISPCAAAAAESDAVCVAAAYDNGFVVVIDLSSRTSIYSCQHDTCVQSVSWAPSGGGRCLATACKDQSVQLWKLGSEGEGSVRKDEVCAAPSNAGDSRTWTSVCALSAEAVLYSGARGDVFCWDASKRKAQRAAPLHTRPIFTMKAIDSEHMVTASMDRLVILWSVKKGVAQMKWRLNTIGGHVTCMKTDGANLAVIGCGDSGTRVIDLMHREHRQHCWVVWKGLRTSISSICVGPVPGTFAYGLQDGGFGFLPATAADGPGDAFTLPTKSHPGPVTAVCCMRPLPSAARHLDALGGADDASSTFGGASSMGDGKDARGKGKGKGKGKKAGALPGPSKELLAIPAGSVLVSLSAGKELWLTSIISLGLEKNTIVITEKQKLSDLVAGGGVDTAAGGGVGRRTGDSKEQSNRNVVVHPSAAVVWSLPQTAGGDALVLATTQPPQENSVAVHSLHLLQLRGDDQGRQKLEAARGFSLDGVDGGTTAMCLFALGADQEECMAACGTSAGSLAVFKLRWAGTTEERLSRAPDVLVQKAHDKGVADVQSRSDSSCDLLTAGQDGIVKMWRWSADVSSLQCLHSVGSPLPRGTNTAVLTACFDNSAGGPSSEELAFLAGGRDQIAYRWCTTESGHTGSAGPGSPPVAAEAPTMSVGPAAKAGAKAKAKVRQSTLVPLASSVIYEQDSKMSAIDFVKAASDEAPLPVGSPLSLGAAIVQNRQSFADWWAQEELQSKVSGRAHDGPFRARLLRLWTGDIEGAVMKPLDDLEGSSVPAAWLWAALSPASGTEAWSSAVQKLRLDARKKHANADSVHYAVAANLADERDEDAIRLLVTADLLLDALLLARLRLPGRHPIVKYIYDLLCADMAKRGRMG